MAAEASTFWLDRQGALLDGVRTPPPIEAAAAMVCPTPAAAALAYVIVGRLISDAI